MPIRTSTLQLLRFHFSLFLLPVFLFAAASATDASAYRIWGVALILHLLVYPASNGYNSYMDRDETAIGGLSKPMQPTRQLFVVTVIMDITAILLSAIISVWLALGIIFYIAASRAYSYRGIRLKRYPIVGFLTVFMCQGALIYLTIVASLQGLQTAKGSWMPALISSCLIGALYPLTQIYQHEADKADGVETISMKLGLRGTFLLSMTLFISATLLLSFWLSTKAFILFLSLSFPVVVYFLHWMRRVFLDPAEANFKHSLIMNILSTLCTSAFFIYLILATD